MEEIIKRLEMIERGIGLILIDRGIINEEGELIRDLGKREKKKQKVKELD